MRINSHVDYRGRMFLVTFFSDLSALILSVFFIHWLLYRNAWFDGIGTSAIDHFLFVMICLALFMATNLYPGIGLNPAMEMKSITQLTLLSFLIVFGFVMIRSPLWSEEKLILILISGLSVIMVLGIRWLVRILAVLTGLWGEPVVLIANRGKIDSMAGYFHQRHRLGFLPVLGVTEKSDDQVSLLIQMLDVNDLLKLPDDYFSQRGIETVLVSTQIGLELSRSKVNHDLLRKFKRMIFVSDMDWLEGVSITYHDFEGMIGMEARQNLLTPLNEILKRATDVFFSLMLGVLSLPILLLTALVIKLDSPGPIFYSQERVGKGGRKIVIYKFRSMLENADIILAEYFSNHPAAQHEWAETQKLREDPRITRTGKWLRKFSVDELPQLLNIFKGDMSIVGPRPIMENEIWRYEDNFKVYSTVRPGITGMWQVSGRNHTSYKERVLYDVYYVRNWSIWLDIYILLRTVWVVISRNGAY
jgi:Undecaprenyl-phosphate galactose phosphotransferase WbaP